MNYRNDLVIITSCTDECFNNVDSASWIIDSRVSFHATSRGILFTTYTLKKLGMMRMRNDNKLCVVGMKMYMRSVV